MSTPSSNTPSATSKTDDRLSVAESVARYVAEGVSGSGMVGLEGPAKTVLGIITHVQRVRDNSSACKGVIRQLSALTDVLKLATESVRAQIQSQALPPTLVRAQLGSSAELKTRIDQLQNRLNEISANAEELQKQSRLKRVVMSNRNVSILKGISDSLQQARNDFTLTGQLAIEIVLHDVAAQVKAAAERQKAQELESALEKLPYADANYQASVHARHGRLLAGTRVQMLEELDEWASAAPDNTDFPFYILSGGGGTGKSTIAYEVASRAERAGRLGASFFFMRGSALLSTTEVVFPTLARQLIANVPALRDTALAVVNDHLKHGARQNMDRQAQDLFTGLLSKLPDTHPPILVVVDAVDECTESAQDLVPRMLALMLDAVTNIPCRVRIFVTSRPEVHIEDAFQSVRFTSKSQKFRLHEIPRPVVDLDIRFYFSTAIAELPETSRTRLLTSYPDAPADLTDLAAGLFIYAATAMEFLKQHRSAIVQGMDRLVAAIGQSSKPSLRRLDELYIIVLSTAFLTDGSAIHGKSFKRVLGCVAMLQDQISPRALAILTGLSLDNDILPILDRLVAVLAYEINNPDSPMRTLHASFAEFLVDPSRCTDPEFYVEPAVHHSLLAENCLSLLNRPSTLVRNICRLPNPAAKRSEVNDLLVRVSKYLPDPVPYACSFWPVHLACSETFCDVLPQLTHFCERLLLEWLEAAAFLDSVDNAIHWLPHILELISPSDSTEALAPLLHDIYRLAVEFAPAIKACPGQLYISGLPLTPSTSKLRSIYAEILLEPCTLLCRGRITESWHPWSDVEPSGSHSLRVAGIQKVLYVPHGRWVAIIGKNGDSVHFCRPDTGDIVQSITAHASPLLHIHCSSNGLRMALTFTDRVCVVSTRSGSVLHEVAVEPSAISAHFVLEEKSVVILSRPQPGEGVPSIAISIWTLGSSFTTDVNFVSLGPYFDSIAVSGNGRWMIITELSGMLATNATARVLDLVLQTAPRNFSDTSLAVCFVPKTESVVLKHQRTLCMCDVSSGDILRDLTVETGHTFNISISQDGATIVVLSGESMSSADTILVLSPDGLRCRLSAVDIFHVDISPTGTQILGLLLSNQAWRLLHATYSANNIVALTDRSLTRTDSFYIPKRYRAQQSSVCISYDCSMVAVGVAPGTVRLFSSRTGTAHTFATQKSPRSLAISSDSRRIAVVSLGSVSVHDISGDILYAFSISHSPIPAAVLQRVSGYDPDTEHISESYDCAAFTMKNDRVIALMHILISQWHSPGRVLYALACWDLESPVLRGFRVVHGLGPVDLVEGIRCNITAGDEVNFSLIENGKEKAYSVQLPDWDAVQSSDEVHASTTASMPDEQYHLSLDGWITHIPSLRDLCWIPLSRRPSIHHFCTSVSTRGHVIATMSSSGLLTVLDMSNYH